MFLVFNTRIMSIWFFLAILAIPASHAFDASFSVDLALQVVNPLSLIIAISIFLICKNQIIVHLLLQSVLQGLELLENQQDDQEQDERIRMGERDNFRRSQRGPQRWLDRASNRNVLF